MEGNAAREAASDQADWDGMFGPSRGTDGSRIELRLEEQHSNSRGRMHGALAMGALASTMRSAADVHAPRAELRSIHFDFVASAALGETIESEAQVIRVTRTLVFVRAEIRQRGHRCVMASGIFQRESAAQLGAGTQQREDGDTPWPSPAWRQTSLDAPFSRHGGPVYRAEDGAGRLWGLRVLPRHLERGAVMGAALLLADVALGSESRHVAGGKPCATLSLCATQSGRARVGDFMAARCSHQATVGDIHFMSARIGVGSSLITTAFGCWKELVSRGGVGLAEKGIEEHS